MRLLDRYILAEWFKVFALALLVTVGLLLLEDMNDDLPDFFGWGATAGEIFRYYLIYLPGFLPEMLPVALMISLLFVLGNLHRNNEVIAMRAVGLSLFRITRSLWVAGTLLAGLLFYLNAELVPWSVESARTIRENLKFSEQASRLSKENVGLIRAPTFDNQRDNRLWFLNRFSEYTYQGFGISIYQLDEERRETRRIMAREGYYDTADGHWYLLEGRELTFDPETGDPIRVLPFDKQPYPELTEPPRLMKTLSKPAEDLSFLELQHILSRIPPDENPAMRNYAVRYHAILASPIRCLIVVGLAIPFALGGVRTNPMVGVCKAGGLFFGYYVIEKISQLLGAQAAMPVIVAAWLPNLLMLGLAIWLFRRVD